MDLHAVIRASHEIGNRSGFITFDRLNGFLSPADRFEAEDIEVVLEALSARSINVTEA